MELKVAFAEKSPEISLVMQSQTEVDVVISALQKKVAEQPCGDKDMEMHVIAEKMLMRLNSLKEFLL